MTTDQHLDAILAKCRTLLADAQAANFYSDEIKSAIAGWRSTIAAIEGIRGMANDGGIQWVKDAMYQIHLPAILTAWPIELL